jgi:hypothetical protein
MAARKSRTREAEPPLGLHRRLLAAAGAMATPRRRRLWKWLLAELAIVFLGVSLASLADDYRQHRSDAALGRQVVAALDRSLARLETHERLLSRRMAVDMARFEADRKRGLRPIPPLYREDMAERPPTLVWEALVETGGARVLSPDILFEAAIFFNRMDGLGERYIRYNQFTEQVFLPLARQGGAGFYDPNGALKPEFSEHLERMNEIVLMEKSMAAEGASLRRAIAAMEI